MDASAATTEYDARVNRAVDFIERNLERGLALAEVARVAGFSTYHFHRVFSARVGETVGQFTSRLRLERAAARLLDRTHEPITEVALDLGFSSSATFARAFRAHFGVSASEWRKRGEGRRSNAREIRGGSSAMPLPEIRIESWQALEIAYVRHTGAYAGDAALFEQLFGRLLRWAEPRELITPETRLLSLYHDPPGVTGDERLRLSAGLVLPDRELEPSPGVGRLSIRPGRWAVGAFELAPSEYARAWSAIYAHWLPSSGYQPAHGPALEIYPARESTRADARHVEICVPVEPLFARPARRIAR